MANKPKSMLEIRKMLQLLESDLSNRKIALQLSMSRNTLDYYRLRFKQSGKSLSELLALPDHELALIVHKERAGSKKDNRYERLAPLIEGFAEELKRTGVTRLLLWEEYRQRDTDGYSYQQFCEHINTYMDVSTAVMRLEHRPGDTLEFDFAGDKMSYVDKGTGELVPCPVFVAVLPFSGYTFCQAMERIKTEDLLPVMSECVGFYGGMALNVLTDNMKQIVTKSHSYEPTFTELAMQWSVHYNTNLQAARVRRPKDKASVEKAVDLVYKRIYAPLRDQIFYSLKELNHHIRIQLEKHNEALFQKRDYSRKERFLLEEKKHLLPLPSEPFDLKYSLKRKVGKDYHVTLGQDKHHYSVPFRYMSKKVILVYDSLHVEIYFNMERIAFHQRDYRKHYFTTNEDHMPEKHRAYKKSMGWNTEYFIDKASTTGPLFREYMEKVIASRKFTEQAYKSCLGLLRISGKYPRERMEKASQMALTVPVASYKTLEAILINNRDKQLDMPDQNEIPPHDNIRGKQQYLDF